ncbi:MAG: glutaredoxin family protein [Euryarchaeota archaeon]|nr:glutaredoxin family protein [Euryarchaeota archaeon]
MKRQSVKVKAYTLSTCPHCSATKEFLRANNVDFDYVDVDLLTGEERTKILREVYRLTQGYSFPVIVIGDSVIVGFNKERLKQELHIA